LPVVEVRSLAYRTDLMVRRLAGSSVVDRGDHLVVRTRENPWFHWGNFLLLDGLPAGGALEGWVARFGREFPGAGHVALGIDGTEFPESPELPSSLGLEVERGVVLTGRRPPPSGPAGTCAIRPLRTAHDWDEELRLRQDEADADGPRTSGHAEYLRRRTAEAARLVAQGWAAYFGAFQGDRLCSVAGIASDRGGVARYQNVATRAECRRQGLASRVLAEAGAFAASSMNADLLVIVADQGSDAARLYQSLGFTPAEAHLGLSASAARASGPAPNLPEAPRRGRGTGRPPPPSRP
jgi:ribosomal protein S18 acetylase RimI-like enzyme